MFLNEKEQHTVASCSKTTSYSTVKYLFIVTHIVRIVLTLFFLYIHRYYGRRGNDSSSELSISDDDEKDKNTNNIKPP